MGSDGFRGAVLRQHQSSTQQSNCCSLTNSCKHQSDQSRLERSWVVASSLHGYGNAVRIVFQAVQLIMDCYSCSTMPTVSQQHQAMRKCFMHLILAMHKHRYTATLHIRRPGPLPFEGSRLANCIWLSILLSVSGLDNRRPSSVQQTG